MGERNNPYWGSKQHLSDAAAEKLRRKLEIDSNGHGLLHVVHQRAKHIPAMMMQFALWCTTCTKS